MYNIYKQIDETSFLQTFYDNTCAMREKRLDIEEALVDEKKNRDGFVKDADAVTKKAKVIESSLKTAENELEAFQVTLY